MAPKIAIVFVRRPFRLGELWHAWNPPVIAGYSRKALLVSSHVVLWISLMSHYHGLQYSMYGHIQKLAEAEKAGIEAAGGTADLYQ